jgi:alkylation response protein AidB-like acyl-CoA dehydrogenase
MAEYAIDRRDIEFLLFEHLEGEKLFAYPRFSEFNRELVDAIMEQAHAIAKEVLYPLNGPADRTGCKWSPDGVAVPAGYAEAFRTFRENGWLGMAAEPEHGGQGLPWIVAMAAIELLTAANAAFMMYPGLTIAAANMLAAFGNDWMKSTAVQRLYKGEWAGTMCLTEAQAGSAVGDLTTKAVPEGDHYRIEGNKVFISCGEQNITDNIIHLVLARIPGDPPGTKGISLFLVPKVRFDLETGALLGPNDVKCTGIEHKMGINGSATCSLAFGEGGACHGYLVGEPRQGMKIMFHMMNEARIECGMQGAALAAAAYASALGYAKERVQGQDVTRTDDPNLEKVRIVQHPDVRRMLLDMKATSEAIRALIYFCTYHIDLARAHPDEATRRESAAFVELLTPICKAFASDQGFRVTETAIQTYGGYGYIKEYGVEQYCRDEKIASIYEGTNGIQALDLIGRKMPMRGGAVFMNYMSSLNKFIDAGFDDWQLAPAFRSLAAARDRLNEVAVKFMEMGQAGDRAYPVLSAVPFLELFGYTVCGHLLLEQAKIAAAKLAKVYEEAGAASPAEQRALCAKSENARFYAGKLASAKYWAARKLPLVHALADGILAEDRTPLEPIF